MEPVDPTEGSTGEDMAVTCRPACSVEFCSEKETKKRRICSAAGYDHVFWRREKYVHVIPRTGHNVEPKVISQVYFVNRGSSMCCVDSRCETFCLLRSLRSFVHVLNHRRHVLLMDYVLGTLIQ